MSRTGVLSDSGVRLMCPEGAPIPLNRTDLMLQPAGHGLRVTRPATAKAMIQNTSSLSNVDYESLLNLYVNQSLKRPPPVQPPRFNITPSSGQPPRGMPTVTRPTATPPPGFETELDSDAELDSEGYNTGSEADDVAGHLGVHPDFQTPQFREEQSSDASPRPSGTVLESSGRVSGSPRLSSLMSMFSMGAPQVLPNMRQFDEAGTPPRRSGRANLGVQPSYYDPQSPGVHGLNQPQ